MSRSMVPSYLGTRISLAAFINILLCRLLYNVILWSNFEYPHALKWGSNIGIEELYFLCFSCCPKCTSSQSLVTSNRINNPLREDCHYIYLTVLWPKSFCTLLQQHQTYGESHIKTWFFRALNAHFSMHLILYQIYTKFPSQ